MAFAQLYVILFVFGNYLNYLSFGVLEYTARHNSVIHINSSSIPEFIQNFQMEHHRCKTNIDETVQMNLKSAIKLFNPFKHGRPIVLG